MLHILLDAEAFRHEQLHFASKRFQQLTAFVSSGRGRRGRGRYRTRQPDRI